jgi:hypothetical protein
MATFDWKRAAAYNDAAKKAFHRQAAKRLRELAAALGLAPNAFEVRSNKGGIAVSGEVTLHGEWLYVQASQPYASADGLLLRSCRGRRDYTGGRNRFLRLEMLDDPEELARWITEQSGIRAEATMAGAGT